MLKKDPDTNPKTVQNVVSSRSPQTQLRTLLKKKSYQLGSQGNARVLEGGEAKSEQVLRLYQSIERDPILQTRPEQFDITSKGRKRIGCHQNQPNDQIYGN